VSHPPGLGFCIQTDKFTATGLTAGEDGGRPPSKKFDGVQGFSSLEGLELCTLLVDWGSPRHVKSLQVAVGLYEASPSAACNVFLALSDRFVAENCVDVRYDGRRQLWHELQQMFDQVS